MLVPIADSAAAARKIGDEVAAFAVDVALSAPKSLAKANIGKASPNASPKASPQNERLPSMVPASPSVLKEVKKSPTKKSPASLKRNEEEEASPMAQAQEAPTTSLVAH